MSRDLPAMTGAPPQDVAFAGFLPTALAVPTHAEIAKSRYVAGKIASVAELDAEIERLLAEGLADEPVPLRMGGLPPAPHHDPTGAGARAWREERERVYMWP